MERCPLCGFQAISCGCIYEVCGISQATMEVAFPEIFFNGPTPKMFEIFDAHIEEKGGRIPWAGEYHGKAECREYGFWRTGEPPYARCNANHPGAEEYLELLYTHCFWDVAKRRFVKKAN